MTLDLHLLGGFRIVYRGRLVEAFSSLRLQSLLCYLVLHRQTPQPRHHVAFLFWPDSSEAQARTNLRRELHHLRQALPEADKFLWINANTLQWRSEAPVILDVSEFENAVRQAEEAKDQGAVRKALEEAVVLYHGDLLPGCYDEWILPERERLRQTYLGALERLMQLLEEAREYSLAIRYGRRLLQLDPLHEASYRRLMRLHALNGDRAGAVHVYHNCATVLQRELDIEPSPTTRETYQRLLDMDTLPQDNAQRATLQVKAPALRESPGTMFRAATLPLVGRQREWEMLLATWRSAARGQAHMAMMLGEAGIGKTRLAEELLEWAGQQGIATVRTRCYAAEGRLAYAPVAELLHKDALRGALSRLEDVWLREVARLLPELLVERPGLPRAEPLTEAWQRRRLFEALVRAVLAASQPLLLLIDDLQWCDRDTLEWLHYLLRFDPGAKLLVVGTIRSEELEDNQALSTLLLDLRKEGQLAEITLGPLDLEETVELASNVVGQKLAIDVQVQLFQETEGQPLFVVETARAGLTLKAAAIDGAGSRAAAHALPLKVQAVIAARLSQLSPQARELAHLAATIGRAFSFEVLGGASDLDEAGLVHALDELWQRRIVREQGASAYDFSHDRIRDVAYLEVSPIKCRLLHRRVAQTLELLHAPNLDGVSAELARHYEQAGQPARAIEFYRRAAEVARQVYANEEAIRLLSRALALLKNLPDNAKRDEQELALQLTLAPLLRISKGFASNEVEQVLSRAQELCQQLKDTSQICRVLMGLATVNVVRGEIHKTQEIAEQLWALTQPSQQAEILVEAHFTMGGALSHLGKPARGLKHFEQAIALYDPQQHRVQVEFFGADLGVFCRAWGAHALWLLGYPDQALAWSEAALAKAEELAHPFSSALAMTYLAMLQQFRREVEATQLRAEMAAAICRRHEFIYYLSWANILRSWIQAKEPQDVARLETAIRAFQASGSAIRLPFYFSLLAERLGQLKRPAEGLELIDQALSLSQKNGDRWWDAELHRLRGALCLRNVETAPEAEAHLRKALDIARQQEAKSLELRAAVSLARLWQHRGRRQEANPLLQEVYSWFTEGFDTADLKEARALLEALS